MATNYSYLETDYWSSTTKEKNPKPFVEPPTGLSKNALITYRKFILLNIITLGLYRTYWGWRLWESVRLTKKENYRLKSSVSSLFLGITALFLFPRLQDLAEKKGYKAKYNARLIACANLFFPLLAVPVSFFVKDPLGRLVADIFLGIASNILTTIILLPIVDMHNHYTLATKGKYFHTKPNKWLTVFLAVSFIFVVWSFPFTYKMIASERAFIRESTKYTSTEDKFSINFPGSPAIHKQTSRVKSGQAVPVTVYKRVYGSDNEHYDVIVFKWPTQVVDFSTMSQLRMKQFLSAAAYENTKEDNSFFFGNSYENLYSGSVIADNAQLFVHYSGKLEIEDVRVLVVGQNQYDILTINAPKSNFDSFANSFNYISTNNNASLNVTYQTNDCGGPAGTPICPDSSSAD